MHRKLPFTLPDYEPSLVLFPTIINKYLTGSRAEYLYAEDSDYDYLYEIGPGVMRYCSALAIPANDITYTMNGK